MQSILLRRHLLPAMLLLCFIGVLGGLQNQVHGQANGGDPVAAADPAPVATSWGTLRLDPASGWGDATIDSPAAAIALPTPLPNITRAWLGTPAWLGQSLQFSFNTDATEIELHLPPEAVSQSSGEPLQVALEIAELSQQFPDGRIVLSALDAKVEGKQAKLESHPGSHRIGFWANAEDFVRWNYAATRPGMYQVELTYSVAGKPGSEASDIEVHVGAEVLPATLTGTGSWYRYTTVSLGKVYLPAKAKYDVAVKCTEKRGGAVMNLKSLTLVPTCEGSPPTQSADGRVILHAQDVTSNGVLLQWEPRDIKRTLGFWAKTTDSAYWDFTITDAGVFDVEILQGCGKGQGGSEVDFVFLAWQQDQPTATLPHTVKDTGHWQGFQPMEIGQIALEAGRYRVRVVPRSKAGAAVMDLRQISLTPAK